MHDSDETKISPTEAELVLLQTMRDCSLLVGTVMEIVHDWYKDQREESSEAREVAVKFCGAHDRLHR